MNGASLVDQDPDIAKAWEELKSLAETWNIPVTTSIEGKSAFPEDHPLSLGSGGRANPRPVKRYLEEADVIFGIGCSFARSKPCMCRSVGRIRRGGQRRRRRASIA